MKLQATFNNTNMQSQDFPGFATIGKRLAATITLIGALFVAFFSLGDNPDSFILSMPKAQASASMEGGVAEFSPAQLHYIRRALNSNFDNISKLQGATVRAALDAPEMVRADLPTVVWQYRSDQCVLDIYFKSEEEVADFANVVHYEMRHRDATSSNFAGEQKCLRSIMPYSAMPRMMGVSAIYKTYIQ